MPPATIPSPAVGTSRPLAQSTGALWGGRVLLAVAVLFLLFDITIKLMVSPEAVEGTTALGYATHHMPILAALEVVCLVLYLIPRTAPIGAVLWTGYLGGAIATHLRIDNPLFSHILFPVYVAALLWAALYLRDARVRALIGPSR